MKVDGQWMRARATQSVCEMLIGAGYQALFVGGCVRNALLDAPVKDIDIATDALPNEVMKLARQAGMKPVPTGIDHGTITVVSDHVPHEITTFRKDIETFGRHAVVAFSNDVCDDARRRDFTMNALYAGPDGTVIDPLGGLDDLHARRFRFIEDAEQRIQEDYLRILRFFRFHAWYGDPEGGLDADAMAAIALHLDGLAGLSRERVGSEILKLLEAPDPAISVAAMYQIGVLNAVLPGANMHALGPLIHLEATVQRPADAIRRLAALGGADVGQLLRLSKAQAKRLILLHELTSNLMPAAEIGYRHGADLGHDVLLLRAAMLETPLVNAEFDLVAQGAGATFPLKAADLQPEFSGPELGQALRSAEQFWIDSGFTLGAQALLDEVTHP
mgnify:CR=1 FL=1